MAVVRRAAWLRKSAVCALALLLLVAAPVARAEEERLDMGPDVLQLTESTFDAAVKEGLLVRLAFSVLPRRPAFVGWWRPCAAVAVYSTSTCHVRSSTPDACPCRRRSHLRRPGGAWSLQCSPLSRRVWMGTHAGWEGAGGSHRHSVGLHLA